MADIDNYRQNHPEYVVQDLRHLVDPAVVRRSLKYRGINKWLRVRRLLIQLKIRWCEQIAALEKMRADAKREGNWRRYWSLGGRIQQIVFCRQQVRALCHSPRDVDFREDRQFDDRCKLPADFPEKPHKRWFWRHDEEESITNQSTAGGAEGERQ